MSATRALKPAAVPTLRTWLTRGGPTTRAFAARGLGTLKDAESRAALEALVKDEAQPSGVRVQAIRALAAIADRRSVAVLAPLVDKAPSRTLRLEAVTALGAVADPAGAEVLVDYLEDEWAPLRAAPDGCAGQPVREDFPGRLASVGPPPARPAAPRCGFMVRLAYSARHSSGGSY